MESTYEKLGNILPGYIDRVKNKTNTEDKIVHEFTYLIQKVFDVGPEELDFQVSTTSKVLQLRGRMDAVFSNIILEFKKDLNDKQALNTALIELKKYFQSLYEKNSKTKHVGIATDGLYFKVYRPIIENNIVLNLELINEINLDLSSTETVFNWFDSYFFTSTNLVPTSEHMKQMFGLNSGTYAIVKNELLELYNKVEDYQRVKTKFNNWAKLLEIVHGDKPSDINLFIAHTYLSTFAKLLIYLKLSGQKKFDVDIPSILYGSVFDNMGVKNYVEDDFFTWITYPAIRESSNRIFEKIMQDLRIYDLNEINEDILKELYQEMIKPEIRKQLGEFYTPDWLADTVIGELLSDNPKKSILDPSCGSGTFLFKSILFKIKKLRNLDMNDSEILKHILENVSGFDIHPLAALIAKTNFILALKDLLHSRNGPMSIPIFLSDSIKIPENKYVLEHDAKVFVLSTDIENFNFLFPEIIVNDVKLMNDIIEKMKQHGHDLDEIVNFSKQQKNPDNFLEPVKNLTDGFQRYLKQNIEDQKIIEILTKNIQTLFNLILKDSDSIWPYILRNMYQPIIISNKKVDLIIGNPPWITLKSMHNEKYQNFLKQESKKYGLLDSKKVHNMPHLELSTLFFCKCVDMYLKDDGKIGFVMPKSVLLASHHENFREYSKPQVKLEKIYDLENTSPLFNTISCVLIAQKNSQNIYPVKCLEISGKLSKFNEQLIGANKALKITKTEYSPVKKLENFSYYHGQFFDGAAIYPRCFYHVEIKSGNDSNFNLGLDLKNPLICSEFSSNAKKPWDITLEGNVDNQFLFDSLLGTDILPFGIKRRRLVVLPIIIKNNVIKILKNKSDAELVDSNSSNYFNDVEKMWIKNRTVKSKKFTVYEWLNYRNKLTDQNFNSKYRVHFTASATYITSVVINTQEQYYFKINENKIKSNGFFSDVTTYYFDTNSESEAHYLCSVLNSPILNKLIKPYQTKGTFGPRDIHKRPLMFNIPKFNLKNEEHLKLSSLSKICHKKIETHVNKIKLKSTGKIRSLIREHLKDELIDIDKTVKELLKDDLE